MVMFTCSNCGDSIKKNQVEKHYSMKRCRGVTPALTCVNCMKNYEGDEYIAHTSCVTEEKYSAEGSTSKPPQEKGKRKQENWIKFIQKCLDGNADLDGQVKSLLNYVASNPGLPQKKIKFLNYCKNTYRSKFSDIVINEAWEFLDKKRVEFLELQATEKYCEEDKKRKRMDSSNECSTEFFGNGNNDASRHTPENLGKKKPKRNNEPDNCANKPPSDEGKKMRENWINFIRNILDGNVDLDGQVKDIINLAVNGPGLPQKKKKFLNYCKNTYRSGLNDDVINEAWEFLNKKRTEFLELQTIKQNGEGVKKRKRMDSSNECSTESVGNGNNGASKPTPESLGKKKQKTNNEQDNCANKPSSEKGKKKQENWINFIQKSVDGNEELGGQVKDLLNSVASKPGLPQKKIKFLNFCKNICQSKFSDIVINEAWEFLDNKRREFPERQPTEKNGEENKKPKQMDSSNDCSTEFFGNGNNDASKHTPENVGKKKQRRNKGQDNCAKLKNGKNGANVETESKKQKKKKTNYARLDKTK